MDATRSIWPRRWYLVSDAAFAMLNELQRFLWLFPILVDNCVQLVLGISREVSPPCSNVLRGAHGGELARRSGTAQGRLTIGLAHRRN